MEMPVPWKSHNDFHRTLEISLSNARFPHSHSPLPFVFGSKRADHVSNRKRTFHLSSTGRRSRDPKWSAPTSASGWRDEGASLARRPRRSEMPASKGLQNGYECRMTVRRWSARSGAATNLTSLRDAPRGRESGHRNRCRQGARNQSEVHRRNPSLRRWVNQQLREGNEYLIGPVVRMLGTTAIRAKSPKHAELFLKAVGAIGAKEDGESGAGQTFAAGHAVYNFLVPAPIPTLVHAEANVPVVRSR